MSAPELTTKFDFEEFKKFATEEEGWKFNVEKHNVKAYTRTIPGSSLNVSKGVAVIDAPLEKVLEVIVAAEKRPEWDKLTAECREVRAISDVEKIWYMKTVNAFMVSSRDFVIHFKLQKDEATGAVVSLVKTEEPKEEIPPQKGCVRGKVINSGYVIEPVEGDPQKTSIIYVIQRKYKNIIVKDLFILFYFYFYFYF